MAVKWRWAKKEDIAVVAANMREIDRQELALAGGVEPYEALKQSVEQSKYCRCIEFDGEAVALFGVNKPFILGNKGFIWLLGTDGLAKIKKNFVQNSMQYVNEGFEYVDCLENYVWNENKLSMRWLKWCGFKFDEPAPYGLKKALFMHFYKEKEDV